MKSLAETVEGLREATTRAWRCDLGAVARRMRAWLLATLQAGTDEWLDDWRMRREIETRGRRWILDERGLGYRRKRREEMDERAAKDALYGEHMKTGVVAKATPRGRLPVAVLREMRQRVERT